MSTLQRIDGPGDAELISAVRGGDVSAYGELFERHVQAARRLARQLVSHGDVDDLVSDAFAKVLAVLQRGGGPDLAFRAYLLTAVRRLHVDKIRATSRLTTTDDMEAFDPGVPFRDTAVEGFENAAAAKAFASLPERWQLVLWHTEVEGAKPADVALLLGMSPNSVSALAYRAREGLRQAFLNMHVQELEEDSCKWTHEHVGAYVRKAVSKRDAGKVEAHLDECRKCMAIYLELSEVNSNLSGILAPLLLGSAGAGYVAASAGVVAKAGLLGALGRGRDFVLGRSGDAVVGNAGAATATGAGGTVGTAAVVSIAAVVAAVVGGVLVATGVIGGGLFGGDDDPSSANESPGTSITGPGGIPSDSGSPSDGTTPSDSAAPPGSDLPTSTASEVPSDTPTEATTGPTEDPTDEPTGPTGGPGGGPTPGEDEMPDSDGGPVTLDLLANDGGSDLRLIRFSQPNHGEVTRGGPRFLAALFARENGVVTYTPDRKFKGADSFTYVVGDGSDQTNEGNVRVRVRNGVPVAVPDESSTRPNSSVEVDVLANDHDPNGDDLGVAEHDATSAEGGTVTRTNRGLTYEPLLGFRGVDSFTYRASDGDATSDATTVTVAVANAAPVAVDDQASTGRNRPVDIAVLANDTDPDGDTLTITDTSPPGDGTVTVNDDGTISYTPATGFTGTDTFDYTITDGIADDTATVTVAVANHTPDANDDQASTGRNQPVDIAVLANDTDPDGDTLTITDTSPPADGTVTVNDDGTISYTPATGFTGTDTFGYTITDGIATDTATVTVAVANHTPDAVDDQASTGRNQPVDIAVLANDTDPDGDTLTITDTSPPGDGTVTVNDDGTISYTPATGFTGTDTFDYTITDGIADDTATVTVAVGNHTPDAVDDQASTGRNQPVDIAVLANDTDPDGDTLTITDTSPPGDGTLEINPDGTISYTPATGFTGTDTFDYTITDGIATDTATVTVAVANHTPDAIDDQASTGRNQPVDIAVLANDNDPDGDTLTITDTSPPGDGTLEINPDGTISYTPATGFTGTDTFDYTITDGIATDTATVAVAVANHTPDAIDDQASTGRNQPVDIAVLANDTDPDGDTLTITDTSPPGDGTVTVNDDGTVTYTPAAGFSGTDTFDYTVTDGIATDTATVTVAVGNHTPDATDDEASTGRNQPVDIAVLANDTDPDGDTLTITDTSPPGDGTVTVNDDGTVTYTPAAGFTGTDTFDYTITDGIATDTATVTVAVANHTPDAVDDQASTGRNQPVEIAVLANDTDPDGDTLTVTDTSPPGDGTVTVNDDGTVTYTPAAGFTGTDSFGYTISDGIATDTATVTVAVANGTPDAVDDEANTGRNQPVDIAVLANDTDPDGDTLTITDTTTPGDGTVTVNDDGTVTYTPAAGFSGTDTFDYTVTDGIATDTATVTVAVANHTPDANDDEASTGRNQPVDIAVLANDNDPDGDTLTVSDTTTPADGTVEVNDDGTISYTPATGFTGTDTFDYTITDGIADDTATVTVAVANHTPDATDDDASTGRNQPVDIAVLANDTDPDGDTLTITDTTTPGDGTVEVNPDGTVSYTPATGFSGTDTFGYTVTDGIATDTATVTVAVGNHTPDAVDDEASTGRNQPVDIAVLANDTDPDGDTLTITDTSPPGDGTVEVNPDGTISYTPATGFTGTDTFDYTVTDGIATDTATVTVAVANHTPDAVDDDASTGRNQPVDIAVLANDTDPDGDTLTITDTSPPGDGTVTVNDDGTLSYTPATGFTGTDTFDYTITDGIADDTAHVTVAVANHTPDATDDDASTGRNQPVDIAVLANDTDPDGDTLTITDTTTPGDGTVEVNPDGTISYTPATGFSGTDTFDYTITDGIASDTATVTVAVGNHTPDAVDDQASTGRNQPVEIAVLANDTDPDGDTLTITDTSPPGDGTVTVNDDGTVTYTPAAGFTGTDTFDYTVTDGIATDTATVTVAVGNHTPDAVDDQASTGRNQPVEIAVLANDTDPDGDTLSVTDTSLPVDGTVTVNDDGTVTYTPAAGFTGTDTFGYTISDGIATDTAHVTVAVANGTPDANDDEANTGRNQPVDIAVLANDTDPDGDTLTITDTSPPGDGTVTVNDDGTVTYTPAAGFSGTDTFDYTVTDGIASDTATVTVAVGNHTPDATDDEASTGRNQPVDIAVLANDTDPDGDTLTITDTSPPGDGTVTVNDDGTVTYTPAAGFTGTDTFDYTITDGIASDTATVTVAVANGTPTANDDKAETATNTNVAIDVLQNDTDPNDDTLTPVIADQPTHGAAEVNDDGTITYTPVDGFKGIDSFTYQATDGDLSSNLATVTITVANAAPDANDDTAKTDTNTKVGIDVLQNDSDPNGDPVSIAGFDETTPGGGTVVQQGDRLVYIPAATFKGTDTFDYTITDGTASDTATVTVAVANGTPSANDDKAETDTNTNVAIDVLQNDSDPNDDTLTPVIADQPTHGAAEVNDDGTITYTPADRFRGIDSFTYRASDGALFSNLATVTITVTNAAPVANDDTAKTDTNTKVGIDVLQNDSDPNGDPVSIAGFDETTPGGGTVVQQGNRLVYIPAATFKGTDTFDYSITDGTATDTATVTVAVANGTPTANDDTAETDTNTNVGIDVLQNDSDPNDDTLTPVIADQPTHGAAEVNDDGTITYTPANGFKGTDSFTYQATDGDLSSNLATVTITVANAAPVANDDTAETDTNTNVGIDVLQNDTDPNDDSLTPEIVDQPAHGAAEVNNNGTITYTPDDGFKGTDSFTYSATDGARTSNPATVTIDVANGAPVANPDTASTDTNTNVAIDVLKNDTDPNGDSLTPEIAAQPANGAAEVNDDGTITYTPDDGFKGTDSFTYSATDGARTSNPATVTIDVANGAPVANPDTASTLGAPVSVAVLDNDVDPNGDSLRIAEFDAISTQGGTITRDGDELVYRPAPGFHGADTSTYVVSDGDGGRDTGTLNITVGNTPPIANDDSSSTPHFTPVLVDVVANDTDLNGDTLQITAVTAPVDDHGQTRGKATVIDGKVRYAPPEGFAGPVTFDYTVADGHGGTDTATVTVTVDNASPVAVDDKAVTDTNTQVTIDVLANDSDPNGDPIRVASVTDPANGSVTVEDDGSLTYYAPAPGFKGPDNFDYTISDGNGGTATATVRVTVRNAPPNVKGERRTMSGDSITVAVLANDTDPNGDTLVIADFDETSVHGGTVSQQGQSLTYTPAAGFHGEDTVDYVVSDGDGGTGEGTLTIEVTNSPPDASPDTVATEADANGSTTIDVLANDTDPNRDTLTIMDVTAAGHGRVAIVDNKLVYSYQADFAGTDTFNYTIADGHEGTSTAKVAVTVTNTKPTAVQDDAVTDHAKSVTINVLANDSDPNGDAISLVSVANPAHGSASIVAGKVLYTPDGTFNGVDTFSYTIRDARGATATGTISVTTRFDLTVSAHDERSGISHLVTADVQGIDPAGSAVLTVRFSGIPIILQSPSQCSRSGSTFTCSISHDGTVGPFHFVAVPGSWSATFDVSPVGFVDADPTNNHDQLP